MVFQSYALYPTKTVRGNLKFGLSARRLSSAEIERRIAWAAKLLQIDHLLDRKPSQLSGGQRQRVAIGRALVKQVGLFLFDEPLSNLDAKLRTEMRLEIKKLHNQLKSTVVYVTHDQIEAMTMATKIAVMNKGVIQQVGTPDEIYDQPENVFVADFVGSPSMNMLDAVVRRQNGAAARRRAGNRTSASTSPPTTGGRRPRTARTVKVGFRSGAFRAARRGRARRADRAPRPAGAVRREIRGGRDRLPRPCRARRSPRASTSAPPSAIGASRSPRSASRSTSARLRRRHRQTDVTRLHHLSSLSSLTRQSIP